MQTALQKAVALILSADAELIDILGVTAEMSIQSSPLALLMRMYGLVVLGEPTAAMDMEATSLAEHGPKGTLLEQPSDERTKRFWEFYGI